MKFRQPASDTPAPDFYVDTPVGEILRRARVKMDLSISDVEAHLRIRSEHLEALERSAFDELPGQVYVIGFIRTYAEFLHLDGNRVIQLLKKQTRDLGRRPVMTLVSSVAADERKPSVPLQAVAIAGVFLIMATWVIYQTARTGAVPDVPSAPAASAAMTFTPETSVPSPVLAPVLEGGAASSQVSNSSGALSVPVSVPSSPDSPALAPVLEGVLERAATAAAAALEGATTPSVASVPQSTSSGSSGVVVTMLADSWIELRNPEGRVVQARLYREGEEISVDNPVDNDGNPYKISIGNAAGVQLMVEGVPLPPLGPEGKVLKNISLDPAALMATLEPG